MTHLYDGEPGVFTVVDAAGAALGAHHQSVGQISHQLPHLSPSPHPFRKHAGTHAASCHACQNLHPSRVCQVAVHMDSVQYGLLTGFAFSLVYAGAGVMAGQLVASYNRKRILMVGLLIWTAATSSQVTGASPSSPFSAGNSRVSSRWGDRQLLRNIGIYWCPGWRWDWESLLLPRAAMH